MEKQSNMIDWVSEYENLEKASGKMSLTEITDEHLCFLLIKNNITNAFTSGFNREEVESGQFERLTFERSKLVLESIARLKKARFSGSALIQAMSAAKKVTLSGGTLAIDKVKIENKRGFFELEEVSNHQKIMKVTTAALVQIWKPEKCVDNKGFQPVNSDSDGQFYPYLATSPAPFIIKAYKESNSVREVANNIAINCEKGGGLKILHSSYVPQLFARKMAVRDTTKEWQRRACEISVRLNPNETAKYKDMCGADITHGFQYCKVPVFNTKLQLLPTLKLVEAMRLIRGDSGKNLGSQTENFYYGDLPPGWGRGLAAAHTILDVLKLTKCEAVRYNPTKVFSSAWSWLALNTKIYDFNSMVSSKAVGRMYPQATSRILEIFSVPTSMMIDKKGIPIFTPELEDVCTQIDMMCGFSNKSVKKNPRVIAIYTMMRPEFFDRYGPYMYPTASPQSNHVWIIPLNTGKMTEEMYCKRMVQANTYKTYYPFHRTPFSLVDGAIEPINIVLKLGNLGIELAFEVDQEFAGQQEVIEITPDDLASMKQELENFETRRKNQPQADLIPKFESAFPEIQFAPIEPNQLQKNWQEEEAAENYAANVDDE
jgi:hypothetical protein